jgi:hypothetical protein
MNLHFLSLFCYNCREKYLNANFKTFFMFLECFLLEKSFDFFVNLQINTFSLTTHQQYHNIALRITLAAIQICLQNENRVSRVNFYVLTCSTNIQRNFIFNVGVSL